MNPPLPLRAVLKAALFAGIVCALVFGIVDALVASRVSDTGVTPLALLGCAAAAVLTYSFVWVPLSVTVALVLFPLLRRTGVAAQGGDAFIRLLRVGLALGLFCELYWWTRPYVFYGYSSTSPQRLASAAAFFAVAYLAAGALAKAIAPRPAGARRGVFVAWTACVLGGAAFLFVQGRAADSRGVLNERNRDMPNVLLVIVDALRQDVLGCYGHPVVKTPALDALAAEGCLFENAFVQVPFTWPSFGSLLTGKYPRRHGLIKMAPGERMAPNITLPYHFKTARKKDGTQLSDGDYVNATFHTGTLSEGSGLLRGFDMRFEATAGHDLVVLDNPWSVLRAHLLLSIFRQKIQQRFDSGIVASHARRWIEANADKRFVAMVHLYSTHTPYDPPREFRDMYVDPAYSGPLKAFYAQHREMIEQKKYPPTDADVAAIRALYYAGVTQADRLIGELVADLERLSIRDDTLVIVTADHGESLGEKSLWSGDIGLWEHNHMVQTNLRVPLVMSWPKGVPPGVRVGAIVDEIDVLPTVCELAGLELPHESGDRGRVDGASLMPLVRGEATSLRPYSFAENGLFASAQDGAHKLVVRRRLLKAADIAAARACFAEAMADPKLAPVLVDLVNDPHEERNVVREHGEDAERLFDALFAWSASMPIALEKNVRSHRDLEEIQRMKDLGYTGEGVGEDDEGECDAASASNVPPSNGKQ